LKSASISNHCTINVAVSGTGVFLKPTIIFLGINRQSGKVWKEINQVEEHRFPAGLHYMVQEKGWMDEQGMLEWIQVMWTKFVESVGGPTTNTYLVMDTFSAHRIEKVRHVLASLRTIVDFVPPHCTSKLQVCDVSVNAPLSAGIQGEYMEFMLHEPNEPIECYMIAHCIAHAKGKVTQDIIMNGFKKIGIYYTKGLSL
jgi:DDE superfamily endonuclease